MTVAQINHAIGAEGIVSLECKTIVSDYASRIWDLLISGVWPAICFIFSLNFLFCLILHIEPKFCFFTYLQLEPEKVCTQIGLCVFNNSGYTRFVSY